MADESSTIRAINWRETFPFTHLFRTFRVAIHPSKVVLALVALLALYAGGRFLDFVWPAHDRAVPGEVTQYEVFQKQPHRTETFPEQRDRARAGIESAYASKLLAYKLV